MKISAPSPTTPKKKFSHFCKNSHRLGIFGDLTTLIWRPERKKTWSHWSKLSICMCRQCAELSDRGENNSVADSTNLGLLDFWILVYLRFLEKVTDILYLQEVLRNFLSCNPLTAYWVRYWMWIPKCGRCDRAEITSAFGYQWPKINGTPEDVQEERRFWDQKL